MSGYCSISGILLKHFVSHVFAIMFYYAQKVKFYKHGILSQPLIKNLPKSCPTLFEILVLDRFPRGSSSGIGGSSVYRGSNLTHHLSVGSVVVDVVQVRE